jgi:hypothetical protein
MYSLIAFILDVVVKSMVDGSLSAIAEVPHTNTIGTFYPLYLFYLIYHTTKSRFWQDFSSAFPLNLALPGELSTIFM